MKQFFIRNIVFAIFFIVHSAWAADTVRNTVENGVAGEFNCAYKGKTASKKCKVTNVDEVVTNKELVAFYGAGAKAKSVKMRVLNILWPDQTRSRFAWGDSMEISNLDAKNGESYSLKFAEWPEIDYKRGLIILDDKEREYVRLW